VFVGQCSRCGRSAEHFSDVETVILKPMASPNRELARPLRWLAPTVLSEYVGACELHCVYTASEILNSEDAGDIYPFGAAFKVDDDVHRFTDQAVQRSQRQVVAGVAELADEPQSGEGLTRCAGVNRRIASYTARQGEEKRKCLAVAYFSDDRHIGSHAKETRHETSQIDGLPLGPRRASLHRCDVRQSERY
jgi:hypothetical protein